MGREAVNVSRPHEPHHGVFGVCAHYQRDPLVAPFPAYNACNMQYVASVENKQF
jgi:hypothetical protein